MRLELRVIPLLLALSPASCASAARDSGSGAAFATRVAAARHPAVVVSTAAPVPSKPPRPTDASPQGASPTASGEPTEAAGRARRESACEPGQELSAREHLLAWEAERQVLSVVRVRPDDTLNLRASPGIHAPVLAQLAFRSGDLHPTGRACSVKGELWLEVDAPAGRGWVNERFARPAAAFRTVSADGERALDALHARELDALVRMLVQRQRSIAGEGPGGPVPIEVVGIVRDQRAAQILLWVGADGDDSISGFELLVSAVLTKKGWRAVRLEQRETCHRGVADGLCL